MRIAVRPVVPADHEFWLTLAKEVEPLFDSPMSTDPAFRGYVERATSNGRAFLATADGAPAGIAAVSPRRNSIAWFAVSERFRRRGIGSALLNRALLQLDRTRPIEVITFTEGDAAGQAAQAFYRRWGFKVAEPKKIVDGHLRSVLRLESSE